MSKYKPKAEQIQADSEGFNKNLSPADDNVQKALGTIDQMSASSQWTTNGNDIYYNTGKVGVGAISPSAKFDIECKNAELEINYVPSGGGFDSYVKLLHHFDGTTGQKPTPDETGKIITYAGNASLSTTEKKFGTASLYLDGSGDYITLADSNDWYFGSGDFTIDFWIKRNSVGTPQVVCCQVPATSTATMWQMYLTNTNALYFYAYDASNNSVGSIVTTNSFISDTTTLHHVAFVRNGANAYIFLDGILQATTLNNPFTTLANCNQALNIGRLSGQYNTYFLNAYLDEFRISKGIARWTSNFTPPSTPYDTSSVTASPKIRLQSRGINKATVWIDGNDSDTIKIDDETGTKLSIAQSTGIVKVASLNTNGFVKTGNLDGTLIVDTATYQETLVSGTNIKTINGNSVLGAGNLVIGGSSLTVTEIDSDTTLSTETYCYITKANVITLPALSANKVYVIDNASTKDVTIDGDGNTIDGEAKINLLPNDKIQIIAVDGYEWRTF